MFEPFFDALASVLNFFYTLVPNYGFAIMAMTLLVMVLITPLTVKSTKSMIQMQRLQPEMKRLQAKHKGDREKLNEEMMKFYRENQINPLGGCLPLLAQMPVFIIMYQLLRGLTTRQEGLGTGIGQQLGHVVTGTPLEPWVFTDSPFRPDHLSENSEMYRALANTSKMNFFGMDLSLSPSQALKLGVGTMLPYIVLLLIMLITGIYQNRQLQARNKSGNVNPQQQAIMKIMPFFLPVFSFGFPAGLALYWCTQNFCRIGTNAYITHNVYKKEHAKAPIETTGRERSGRERGSELSDDSSSGPGPRKKAGGALPAASKNGASSNGKKAGASRSTSKKPDKPTPTEPGKSVKSQRAHDNASGRRSGGANSNRSRQVNQRRSGEPRKTSKPEKG